MRLLRLRRHYVTWRPSKSVSTQLFICQGHRSQVKVTRSDRPKHYVDTGGSGGVWVLKFLYVKVIGQRSKVRGHETTDVQVALRQMEALDEWLKLFICQSYRSVIKVMRHGILRQGEFWVLNCLYMLYVKVIGPRSEVTRLQRSRQHIETWTTWWVWRQKLFICQGIGQRSRWQEFRGVGSMPRHGGPRGVCMVWVINSLYVKVRGHRSLDSGGPGSLLRQLFTRPGHSPEVKVMAPQRSKQHTNILGHLQDLKNMSNQLFKRQGYK